MIFIETLDGTRYDLKSIGLVPLSFILDSPSYKHVTEEIDGRDGHIDLGTTIEGRTMTVNFLMQAVDVRDFALLRSEVFTLFNSRQAFYLINTEEHAKRWLVKVASSYTPQRITPKDATFDIKFISSEAYAESVGTTLNPLQWNADLWQWGQGLTWDDYSYTHTSQNFIIYNAGNVAIDPRFMDLKITIKAVGAQFIQITNLRTNEIYRCNTALSANDTLVIDGIRTTKNGLSATRNTNFKLLSLLPGENSFQVTGATIQSISFDFRFRYL